ncbi:hypothetical protein [Limnobaculum parvum]|uniref:Uncharacterized protein n=1 Tax=Limnobaculum parvum TaxID=2172103 RepID=A0A2Y9TY18_9GAMM|nr:hypothetical protein [Limnobaculum parvum]AWH88633.1 hypothetical protein HYN51_08700 [Limnobaculum parvum]
MIIHIDFPNNLITGSLTKQKNIPCTIRVSDRFEIIFSVVFPQTVGTVLLWDRKLLEERAIARAGGTYTHDEPALITLGEKTENSYEVVDLFVFYNDFGWCPVINNSKYAIPTKFWDSDDEDPDYVPKA